MSLRGCLLCGRGYDADDPANAEACPHCGGLRLAGALAAWHRQYGATPIVEVTCDEARTAVEGILDESVLLRFIDQAERWKVRAESNDRTTTYLLGCQAAALAENAKLRAACLAVLARLPRGARGQQVTEMDPLEKQLREALGGGQ